MTRGVKVIVGCILGLMVVSAAAFSVPARSTSVHELHHIHGLAVDPHDPTILYVATHEGLVRVMDEERWEYVGDSRMDLMGFTLHASTRGLMFVSGHPDRGSHLPNPLGVMVSRDGGQSWQKLALPGEVDLHAMTLAADGKTLYGYSVAGSPGLYRISTTDGTSARVEARGLREVFSLAAHPERPDTLLAGTRGGLLISRNEGRTWSLMSMALARVPVTAVAYHPKEPRILYAYAARPDLGLVRSEDGGGQWRPLGLFLGERDAVAVFAISPRRPEHLYLATFTSGLYRSDDGGKRWQPLATHGKPVIR